MSTMCVPAAGEGFVQSSGRFSESPLPNPLPTPSSWGEGTVRELWWWYQEDAPHHARANSRIQRVLSCPHVPWLQIKFMRTRLSRAGATLNIKWQMLNPR